jgi:hypothetical protein
MMTLVVIAKTTITLYIGKIDKMYVQMENVKFDTDA